MSTERKPSLRTAAIRLAHDNPGEVRKALLKALAQGRAPTYRQILDDLDGLKELSSNLQAVIDSLGSRLGSVDPEVESQHDLLAKAIEGLKFAIQTVEALENLVKVYPTDPKFAKTLADAKKLRDTLVKQELASRKVIRELSKKTVPKEFADLAKKIEGEIKKGLEKIPQQARPSVQAYFWRSKTEDNLPRIKFVVSSSVQSAVSSKETKIELFLSKRLDLPNPPSYFAVSKDGSVSVDSRARGNDAWAEVTSPTAAAEKFLATVRVSVQSFPTEELANLLAKKIGQTLTRSSMPGGGRTLKKPIAVEKFRPGYFLIRIILETFRQDDWVWESDENREIYERSYEQQVIPEIERVIAPYENQGVSIKSFYHDPGKDYRSFSIEVRVNPE